MKNKSKEVHGATIAAAEAFGKAGFIIGRFSVVVDINELQNVDFVIKNVPSVTTSDVISATLAAVGKLEKEQYPDEFRGANYKGVRVVRVYPNDSAVSRVWLSAKMEEEDHILEYEDLV